MKEQLKRSEILIKPGDIIEFYNHDIKNTVIGSVIGVPIGDTLLVSIRMGDDSVIHINPNISYIVNVYRKGTKFNITEGVIKNREYLKFVKDTLSEYLDIDLIEFDTLVRNIVEDAKSPSMLYNELQRAILRYDRQQGVPGKRMMDIDIDNDLVNVDLTTLTSMKDLINYIAGSVGHSEEDDVVLMNVDILRGSINIRNLTERIGKKEE